MAKKKLTTQQEKFKNNILKGMDAKAAYIAAGYKAKGSTAEAAASRLLRNVKVQKTIEKAQKQAAEKAEITQQTILEEYAKIAFFNPKELYDDSGNLKKITELDDDTAAVIAGIDVLHKKKHSGEIHTTNKIKLSDKLKALDSLARVKGMFNDKINLGFNAETLNAILSGLPEEYAAAVREALSNLVSRK